MALTQIRKPIEQDLAAYQQLFDKALQHHDLFIDSALSYIRGRKGKMMRPILVMLIAREQFSQQGRAHEPLPYPTLMSAVTLELLHTASLVHDDVVDESGERRGQSSVNALYGNKLAVLLGDYLLAESLHTAAQTGHLEVVDTISRLGAELSEGEIYQLANTKGDSIDEEGYYKVITHKTASLFRASARLGAVSTRSSDEFAENATKLGNIIGKIFQIRDDIFDYFDDPAIGKPRGNDMAEGKLTLPVIHALLATTDETMHQLALKVRKCTASPEEIQQLIQFTKDHGGIEYAEEQMQHLRKEALILLQGFTDPSIKEALIQYIDFVIDRKL